MTDVVAKSVIAIEIDDSRVGADLTAAEAIFKSFSKRMFEAAKIRPTVDINQFGKRIVSVTVDPKTTEAGMKVIQNIVKEYSRRLSKEANIDVGVDVIKTQRKLEGLFTRIKEWAVSGIGIAIGQAFTFTISRNIERALLGIAKLPFRIASSAVTAAQAQQVEETKLAKAIEATGAAAKKTTSELAKKAKELEKLTGTADNTVLAIQGILVAAKGLDGTNFDRATVAALDLSAALGGDVVNKAEKLAKALQEPEKALEMLRDEGVAFSKDQQDVIKYFVKINDVASAQSFVLDAIEGKYGGAATSVGLFAEKLEEASNRIDTMLESMGGALLEDTQAFANAMGAGVNLLERLAPAATASAVVLSELASAILDLTIGVQDNVGDMDDFVRKVDEWRIVIKQLGDTATTARSKIAKLFIDANEWAFAGVDITKLLGMDKGIEVLEKQAQDKANVLAEQLQNDRDAAKKARDDESKARRDAADKRREDAKRRLEDALLLARAAMDQEQAEKDKKKRLKKEEADEDKRLKAEERARLKAQQDYEKSMGRDSLVGLHQRIQDALYLRRQDAAKQKQQNVSTKGGAAGAAGAALAGAISAGMSGLGAAMSAAFSAVVPPGAKGKKGKPAQTQEEIDADFEKERVKQDKARKNRERKAAFDEEAKKAQLRRARAAAELDKQERLKEEQATATDAIAGMPSLSEQEAAKNEAAARKAFDDKIASDEAARVEAARVAEEESAARRESIKQEKALMEHRRGQAAAVEADVQERARVARMTPEEIEAERKKKEEEAGGLLRQGEEANKRRLQNEAEFERNQRESAKKAMQDAIKADEEAQQKAREKFGVDGEFPPLTSAKPPRKKKPIFAPEGNTPSFAPETGEIKVTVKPEQKEVVSSITTQTAALVRAIEKSGKLGA